LLVWSEWPSKGGEAGLNLEWLDTKPWVVSPRLKNSRSGRRENRSLLRADLPHRGLCEEDRELSLELPFETSS
jgi:hypothetical protein